MKMCFYKSLMLMCFLCSYVADSFGAPDGKREMYQLTVYHYATAAQETVLNHYFQQALVPALHRNGYKNIGVFRAITNDTAMNKTMYVYIPINNIAQHLHLADKLSKDCTYQDEAAPYLNAAYNSTAYTRMEVILLKAFSYAPKMTLPKLNAPKNERVYELRSYESATEKIFANKLHMFNEGGEINLFKQLGFNAVFYGEVIAGSHMPNLMYMTTFENQAEREAHWKRFGSAPEWKKLSALPQYQNNVSHIDITFLQPMAYSDF
jgi:NIPSNAP